MMKMILPTTKTLLLSLVRAVPAVDGNDPLLINCVKGEIHNVLTMMAQQSLGLVEALHHRNPLPHREPFDESKGSLART
jgi:hypothetical protein